MCLKANKGLKVKAFIMRSTLNYLSWTASPKSILFRKVKF